MRPWLSASFLASQTPRPSVIFSVQTPPLAMLDPLSLPAYSRYPSSTPYDYHLHNYIPLAEGSTTKKTLSSQNTWLFIRSSPRGPQATCVPRIRICVNIKFPLLGERVRAATNFREKRMHAFTHCIWARLRSMLNHRRSSRGREINWP